MPLSLAKIEQEAPALLPLAQIAQTFLAKYNLTGHTAKVALCLDYSGSMNGEYAKGSMQKLAEKALVLGTQFDDDGAIDLFLFDTEADHVGDITINNYGGAIDRLRRGRHMGLTYYGKAIQEIRAFYGFAEPKKRGLFSRKPRNTELPVKEPIFVIFLTDGAPSDAAEAKNQLSLASKQPIFFKFLSIGREEITFLEKLDKMPGRFIDNANYQPIKSVDRLTDDKLFDILFEEYPDWLEEARAKGIVQR